MEPEDIEFGDLEQGGLAVDVDHDVGDDDLEAFDSDDEELSVNEELGIDVDESDGTSARNHSLFFYNNDIC